VTLLHVFVTSYIDYCNVVFTNISRVSHQQATELCMIARVDSGSQTVDCGLAQLKHDELHWLVIPEHIKCKLCTIMRLALNGTAP